MGLTVDLVDVYEAEKARQPWRDLVDRALEPNIFMEPTFALAAAQHLPESQRPRFALVWDSEASERRLLGVWPIEARSASFAPGFVKTWESIFAVVGCPLIDSARAVEVVDAVLAEVAQLYGPHHLLLVPHLLKAGATYGLLVSRAQATERTWSAMSSHARAVLRPEASLPALLDRALSANGRRKLARRRRKLDAVGAITVTSATSPDAIREAMEHFLALESSGWKGERSTALLSNAGASTFSRSLVRLMAREGECRIDSLEIDGRPAAMMIVLTSRNRAYFWKTAFDESHAAVSPGVHLTIELTGRQLAEADLLHTDSCAVAGHPIERYWPDRHEVADLAVAVAPGESRAARIALRREKFRRAMRETAKRLLALLRARKDAILSRERPAPTSQA